MTTLLIVDGNNIAHRARYKFSLDNNGVDVSVVFGFLRILLSYIRKYSPESVIVAWDGGIPKFRRERVPSYKANRVHGHDDPLAYEDFIRQLQELQNRTLPLLGVLSVRAPFIEADDLIYHSAIMARLTNYYDRIIVASADDDLLQCTLIDNCVVLNPNKNEIRDAGYIKSTYGIDEKDFIHWRALQGDSSDNIRGVPGIGPKTATKLFQEYKSLSGIVNAAGTHIAGKRGEAIQNFGLEGIANNVYVMALAFDRTGCRRLILDELDYWEPANIKQLKVYLLHNAFVSLMEPTVYKNAKAMVEPYLCDDMRTPVVCQYRIPVSMK